MSISNSLASSLARIAGGAGRVIHRRHVNPSVLISQAPSSAAAQQKLHQAAGKVFEQIDQKHSG